MPAMIALRRAVAGETAALMPWIVALNRGEGIDTAEADIARALDRLLADDSLGRLWWICDAGAPIGYAVVTFGYDLEFAGRDAYLCEMFLAPEARGSGAGHAAIDAIVAEMPALEVRALHLQVRRDNSPALAIYRRAGFVESPRAWMTRVI